MPDADGTTVHVAGGPDIDGLPALTLQQACGEAPGLDLTRERFQGE